MTPETMTILIGGIVSIFMALFGYLKIRDQKRFSSIEEKSLDHQHEIDRLRIELVGSRKTHLECLERATILEAKVKFLEVHRESQLHRQGPDGKRIEGGQ